MFGQSPLAWPPGWPPGAEPFGAVGAVPPEPFEPLPFEGWVAFGAADPVGSAAFTTAAPPTTSRPMASSAVAAMRRAPPRPWPEGSATGCAAGGAGWIAG